MHFYSIPSILQTTASLRYFAVPDPFLDSLLFPRFPRLNLFVCQPFKFQPINVLNLGGWGSRPEPYFLIMWTFALEIVSRWSVYHLMTSSRAKLLGIFSKMGRLCERPVYS